MRFQCRVALSCCCGLQPRPSAASRPTASRSDAACSLHTAAIPAHTHTHTHTHTFNGPLSRTTRVSQYQKGKTNLDFTGARDSERQWHQLGRMQVCTSLQTDNHASTPALSFLQAGCPSCRPTNSVKALKGHFARHMKKYRTFDRTSEAYFATLVRHYCILAVF